MASPIARLQGMPLSFPPASQPDIVRASQKDDYFKKSLYDNLYELCQHYLGPRKALSRTKEVLMVSNLAYYSLSTLLGRQTLGEEYCDIMQVDGNHQIPASFLRRSSLVALTAVVPYLGELLSVYIERFLRPRVQTLSGNEPIKEETRKRWAVWFARFRSSLTIIQRIHIAIFYISGIYYNVPKRLTNMKMIFNRQLTNGEERPSFGILGVLLWIQLIVSFILWLKDSWAKRKETPQLEDDATETTNELSLSTGKCSLCLGPRKVTTATSCGHLFCWSCVTEWCNSKPECPLCRTPQNKSDLLPVYHFH